MVDSYPKLSEFLGLSLISEKGGKGNKMNNYYGHIFVGRQSWE